MGNAKNARSLTNYCRKAKGLINNLFIIDIIISAGENSI